MVPHDAAARGEEHPLDLRCANEECELFRLKLEADEVTPTPASQPDRCAACGQPLQRYDQQAA